MNYSSSIERIRDIIVFRKYATVLMLIILFLFQDVMAEDSKIVRKIEVSGNSYATTKQIKKVIETKEGEEYSETGLNDDIKNIYELDKFTEVMVDVSDYEDGVKVTFIVVEKYLIKRIDFKGNREFKDKSLKNKIASAEKKPFDRKQMLEDVEKITVSYKEKGYSDVMIEPFTNFEDEGKEVTLTFFITEGNMIKVGKINLIGVESFKHNKILNLMQIDKGKIFKPEELEEEVQKIEVFYKNMGFINFKLGEMLVTYNKEKTEAFLTIFMYEGKSYKVGKIEIKGHDKILTKKLDECLQFKKGDVFSDTSLNMSMALINEKYAEQGYIKVSIVPEYDMDDEKGIANIIFRIVEGGIIYINNIYIEGNTVTKDYVIQREFLIKSGDVFDIKKIRRSQEKIYNLGFFQDMRLDLNETEYPDRVDLILSVEEQMSGMISAGMGYSVEYGVMGTIQVQWNNLFGKGQRINFMADFGVGETSTGTVSGLGLGSRTRNFQFSFTEPWLFGKHILGGFDIYSTYRYRDAWRENRAGVSTKIGPNIGDNTNLLFTYTFERVTIPWVRDGYEVDIDTVGTNNSSISAYFIRDTRDSIFDAKRGSRLSLSVEKTGGFLGGNNDFFKTGLTANVFFPLFWKFVIGAQARFGGVFSAGNVPIYERYFVGGGETIRGYDYGFRRAEIGVADGGKLMFVGNVELKVPLAKQGMNTIVQGVLFFDVGGTWNSLDDVSFLIGDPRNRLKAGIGAGIRFTPMPMFPIRLDWGLGLNEVEYDDWKPRTWQFYLTIGPTF